MALFLSKDPSGQHLWRKYLECVTHAGHSALSLCHDLGDRMGVGEGKEGLLSPRYKLGTRGSREASEVATEARQERRDWLLHPSGELSRWRRKCLSSMSYLRSIAINHSVNNTRAKHSRTSLPWFWQSAASLPNDFTGALGCDQSWSSRRESDAICSSGQGNRLLWCKIYGCDWKHVSVQAMVSNVISHALRPLAWNPCMCTRDSSLKHWAHRYRWMLIKGSWLCRVLVHNDMASIHQSTFKGLSSLHYLFMNHNKVSFIEDGALKEMPALQVLWVCHPPLQSSEGCHCWVLLTAHLWVIPSPEIANA